MDKVKRTRFLGHNMFDIFAGGKNVSEGEKERESNILSMIYGVPSVRIRQAKNQISSSRQGLRVGTKNEGFHQRSKEGNLGKSDFLGLRGVLKTFFSSTTL